MSIPKYTLSDGTDIPAIGFGTWRLRGFDATRAILSGLDVGYRLLDSAFNYENEGALGAAVRQTSVPRDEIVVTSKLAGRHHEYALAVAAVEESLTRMGLEHIDLHLIHWPNPTIDRYVEAWQALIDCQRRGLIRSIGVSNFLPEHIDRLVAETGVTPVVNQIERHPFHPQWEQLASDKGRGIRDEAWSPIFRGGIEDDHPELAAIAASHGKTPVQAVLRWQVESGVIPIPKASSPARQAENLDIFDFELTEAETAAINALARPDKRVIAESPNEHVEL
jgi:diketogulonate reductase-like aldo/keto reductase